MTHSWLAVLIGQAGPIGGAANNVVSWLLNYGQPVFDAINLFILALAGICEKVLITPPPWLLALIVAVVGFWRVNGGFAILSLIGLNLVIFMKLAILMILAILVNQVIPVNLAILVI